MDVKIMFHNKELDKEIYIKQCGLNQSSRMWNLNFMQPSSIGFQILEEATTCM